MILLLVNNAVEESLESLGPYIRTLNHTDFKIHVNALRAAKVPVVPCRGTSICQGTNNCQVTSN